MNRWLPVALAALVLAGCGTSAPGSASPSVGPFTADQVQDCEAINSAFGEWPDFATPGDMAAARTAFAAELDKDLTVAQYLAPTAAQAEWDAFVAAMTTARPTLTAEMTRQEFEATYARVEKAGNDLYRACRVVADWGAANLPQ